MTLIYDGLFGVLLLCIDPCSRQPQGTTVNVSEIRPRAYLLALLMKDILVETVSIFLIPHPGFSSSNGL
jgi:hypothetical protein